MITRQQIMCNKVTSRRDWEKPDSKMFTKRMFDKKKSLVIYLTSRETIAKDRKYKMCCFFFFLKIREKWRTRKRKRQKPLHKFQILQRVIYGQSHVSHKWYWNNWEKKTLPYYNIILQNVFKTFHWPEHKTWNHKISKTHKINFVTMRISKDVLEREEKVQCKIKRKY